MREILSTKKSEGGSSVHPCRAYQFYFLFTPLFLSAFFFNLGINIAIFQSFLCCLLLLFLPKRILINRNTQSLLCNIVLIVFIDKLNDFFGGLSLLSCVGPIVYIILFIFFLNNIKAEEINELISVLFKLCIFTVFVNVSSAIVSGIPLKILDRDVSLIFMFAWMLNMYFGKKRLLFTLFVFIINIIVFEARTMILSMLVFILGYYLLRLHISLKIKRLLFYLEIIFGLLIVCLGIYAEVLIEDKSYFNNVFSQHGIVWGMMITAVLESGDFTSLLFGLPSNADQLYHIFSSVLYRGGYDSEYYTRIEDILYGGNSHCTLVYYFYNTGLFGLSLLFYVFYKVLNMRNFNPFLFNCFNAIFIFSLFNGKSLTGVYVISTLFLILAFVDFSKLNKNEYIFHARL